MTKKEERKEIEINYECYNCGHVFPNKFRVERGLTGLKAKGFAECPECDHRVYAKIYLDRE